MIRERLPLDDLKELAETVIADKREEGESEEQARKLYDVPTDTSADLADEHSESR